MGTSKKMMIAAIALALIGSLSAPTQLIAAAACCGHVEPVASEAQAETAQPEAVTLQPQTTCPIMDGAIDTQHYVDKGNQRIFVCCPPCKAKVEADFEGAVTKLAEKGQGPAQAKCPIMQRMTVTPNSRYVDYEGQRIYVCCGSCHRNVTANPEAALKTLAEHGVIPAPVPETKE